MWGGCLGEWGSETSLWLRHRESTIASDELINSDLLMIVHFQPWLQSSRCAFAQVTLHWACLQRKVSRWESSIAGRPSSTATIEDGGLGLVLCVLSGPHARLQPIEPRQTQIDLHGSHRISRPPRRLARRPPVPAVRMRLTSSGRSLRSLTPPRSRLPSSFLPPPSPSSPSRHRTFAKPLLHREKVQRFQILGACLFQFPTWVSLLSKAPSPDGTAAWPIPETPSANTL